MLTKTLIIDTRKELPAKYKKILDNSTNEVIIVKELPIALKFIQASEPDLIIISDSIDENLASFCSQIRVLTYNTRPVIVAVSKSSEIQDRINVIEGGADDFISEPINSEEFKIKIKAHLRREYESNLDTKTNLPSEKYCMRAIKRALTGSEEWGCLLINIENFNYYKTTYTELASDKLLQTFAAIINSTLNENEFLGMISESEFLIITSAMKTEKIAAFLTFAFDTVRSKFYCEKDIERGYIMLQGNNFSERRCEFVTAVTSGITKDIRDFKLPQEIIHELRQTYSLAKGGSKSNYLVRRQQLAGKDSVIQPDFNNRVLILEKDEALELLISTALELKGYKTNTLKDIKSIQTFNPSVVILDTGEDSTMPGLELCKEIKNLNSRIKILATSIFHEKEAVLNCGADIYIPKPYNIETLEKWVEVTVKEFNN